MKNSPTSNMDVKRRNRTNTLRCILNCEKITQPELAQLLALSWPTVLQNVKELTALGLVQEVGSFESTGGRKAKAYAPLRDAKLAVGLEITQNHIGMVLVDLPGQILRFTRVKEAFTLDESYFKRLGELVSGFLGEGPSTEKILGVGVALPGILDAENEYVADSHALGIKDIPTSMFSRHIPYPCTFINDANAAGLAEILGQNSIENLVYLSLSNSVGGAILTRGQLYAGNNLRAGEFGHNTLVPGGRRCYCGKDGCLDAYCSAKVLSDHTDGNLPEFFDRLRAGDGTLKAVWQEYLSYLAIAINNLHMSFDCNVIAGGYVGGFLEEFGGDLIPLLEERNTFRRDASYLKICRYKMEAAAVGAALLQIEGFLQNL